MNCKLSWAYPNFCGDEVDCKCISKEYCEWQTEKSFEEDLEEHNRVEKKYGENKNGKSS